MASDEPSYNPPAELIEAELAGPAPTTEVAAPLASADPVSEPERVGALDVLRGVAVLGILMVNVQSFGLGDYKSFFPLSFGPLAEHDYAAWLSVHVLFQGKFYAIFSMLFGAGMILMADRAASKGRPPTSLHYRRMGGLLVIGLVHAYLIWHGDILVAYALVGMIVFWCRGLHAGWCTVLGLAALAIPSAMLLFAGLVFMLLPEEFHQAMQSEANRTEAAADPDQPPEAAAPMFWWDAQFQSEVADETETFRGSWWQILRHRVLTSLGIHFCGLPGWLGWSTAGYMLLGMAFWKWGLLAGRAAGRTYALLIVLGVVIGFPLTLAGVVYNDSVGWNLIYVYLIGLNFNYWASPLVALSWISAVMLIQRAGWLIPVTHMLAAVGRMALSNYVLQSLICTTLFYGYGFGLFGHLGQLSLVGVAAAIWVLQLILSPLWLRVFRFGPLEWLWRCMTYGRRQPFWR